MDYMKGALSLGSKVLGKTNPNPPVGALIIKDGSIIGRGSTQEPGGHHAEIIALNEAGSDAEGSTMYVTLEPCCHFGRTPPCTSAIIEAGVSEVHIAMIDANPIVNGSGRKELEAAGVATILHDASQEAIELLESYAKFIILGLPFVVVKYAMTLDGKIASRTGHSRWITGDGARKYGNAMRSKSDAVMVGVNTIIEDNPQLTARNRAGTPYQKQPIRVIADSTGRVSDASRVFSEPGATIVATSRIDAERKNTLEARGVEVLCLPEKDSHVSLEALIGELGRKGITSLLVEGGGKIIASLFDEKLVDKVVVFIAPKIVGGERAVTPVEGRGVSSLSDSIVVKRTRLKKFGNDLLFEGYPSYKEDRHV